MQTAYNVENWHLSKLLWLFGHSHRIKTAPEAVREQPMSKQQQSAAHGIPQLVRLVIGGAQNCIDHRTGLRRFLFFAPNPLHISAERLFISRV